VFLLCVMCSSTTAERQSLASRDRTCCLRRCLPARPLRFYGFRGSMAHPTQSLCTLRTRRRRRPRNTRYRAPATAYPDRSLTGRTTPAFLAHKQSISPRKERMDCFVASLLGRKSLKNGVILPTSSLKLSSKAGRCLIHRSQLAMTATALLHLRRHTREGGYPVRRGFSFPSLMSRNTGSPAFAGDDG